MIITTRFAVHTRKASPLKHWTWCIVAALLAATTPVMAFEFSADRIVTEHGKQSMAGVHAKDDRWRLEYAQPQNDAMTAIIRQDQQLTWLVLSWRRNFLQVPIAMAHRLFVNEKLEGEISRQFIGSQELNGYPTEVFEVTTIVDSKHADYYQWVTKEQRFSIRIVSKHGDWSIEYRNVKFLPQWSRYFEPPSGFSELHPAETPNKPGSDAVS